ADIPGAGREPEHGDVGLAVTVVIRRHELVVATAPLVLGHIASARRSNGPDTSGGAVEREIAFAIAIVVADHWLVAARSSEEIGCDRRVTDVPRLIRWAEHCDISAAIAVVVTSNRHIARIAPLIPRRRAGVRRPDVPGAGRGPE